MNLNLKFDFFFINLIKKFFSFRINKKNAYKQYNEGIKVYIILSLKKKLLKITKKSFLNK